MGSLFYGECERKCCNAEKLEVNKDGSLPVPPNIKDFVLRGLSIWAENSYFHYLTWRMYLELMFPQHVLNLQVQFHCNILALKRGGE